MSFSFFATPAQRQYALGLMRKLELDDKFVTLMTLRYFKLAGLPPPIEGASLDATLQGISPQMISALIDVLKKDVEE